MEYGYARVSTKEQNERRQRIALCEFGIKDNLVSVDKLRGDFRAMDIQVHFGTRVKYCLVNLSIA